MRNITDYLKVFRNINKGPRTMDQASLVDDLEPGALKDEMKGNFDPSQETYEEYLRRINLERPFNMAQGGSAGQLVTPSVDGSRPGYGGYDNVYKNKQGNWVFRQGKGDDVIYRSGFKSAKAASAWGEKEFVKKYALPKKWVSSMELNELINVGTTEGSGSRSPFYQRPDRPNYLRGEAEKLLKPVKVGEGTKGQTFWKRPNKKQIEYLKKYSKAPVITEGLAKNIQIILKNKSIMNGLTGVNKGGRTLPNIDKVIEIFKKEGIRISDAGAANALQKISYLLRGGTFQSNVDFKIDKNTGKFITKELEKLNFDERWARGIYKHALNEIREELGDTAGNLESFKRNLRKRLPDGFLQNHGLEINEIFSVRASARNKSFPYAYFIDATDAELNKKALRSFHGALSNAQFNLNNKIKDIRAGKAKYDEAVEIVKKFQKTRNKFKNTIETNYPGKKFNLADIVLGKESEILKKNMKIPEDVYSKKLLNKWADQGLDITGHAKKTGYVMTGAANEGVFTAQDLSRDKLTREKFLKQAGFNIDKCLSSGGRVKLQGGGGVNTCIRGVIEEEQKKAMKGNKVSFEKFGKFGKLARTGAWILGPLDIPIELAFALPHMLAGDKEAAKRATTFGLFGWGKDKLDEVKADSPEAYKYAKHMKDNEDYVDAYFSALDASENLDRLKDLPEHAQKERKLIYNDQFSKAQEKMASIQEGYVGYGDEEGKFDVWGEAQGKSATQDYLIKDVKEKTDKGLDMKQYGGHGMNIALGLPWNFGMKPGEVAPFKGGQPITNLKQHIAQRGQRYWKQLEHAAYEAGVPQLFDHYFATADVREPEDAYSDLPIKYASELAKLEKEEMLRGLKAKGLHGTVGFKKMLEAQGIDPQEVWDVGKKDWEFDILGKRRLRASGGRAGYMGGGITGIRKPHAIPPERQGLRSIMINGKKS